MTGLEVRGFLAALDDRDRGALAELGGRVVRPSGTSLMWEDEHSDHVLVVLQGRVKVVRMTPDGRELLMALRGPGDLVGELAAIEGGHVQRSATVVALEKVTVQSIAASTFLDYLERHPRAMLAVVRGLIARLRDADRRRVEYGSYDTLGRVARLLTELADAGGQVTDAGIDLGVSLSQEELAGMISASRESVARALTTLRGKGFVATGRRSLVVVDLDGLRAFGG